MSNISEKFSPYTSIGNMNLVFSRIRKGWIPNEVDEGEMEKIGITKGNSSRTIAALSFFNLIDDYSKPTETWKAIATTTSNEYPGILEKILRSSYKDIFQIHPNPSDATEQDINNAFAKNEPLGQRDRMANLFRGLCQEAGLISTEINIKERKNVAKLQIGKNTIKKTSEEKSEKSPQKNDSNSVNNTPASLIWYNDLGTLMSRLPNPGNPHWTKMERDKWLGALQAMLDLLIKEDL
jgi:hypothetical protein